MAAPGIKFTLDLLSSQPFIPVLLHFSRSTYFFRKIKQLQGKKNSTYSICQTPDLFQNGGEELEL